MALRLENGDSRRRRTRFSRKAFAVVTLGILLCAGIAGCSTASISSGSLVPGFGTAGVITDNPDAVNGTAVAIAIDSTAMYVVGWNSSSTHVDWRIEKRALTDGSLVQGFGTGGVVTENPGTGPANAKGIAIDSTAMYVIGWDVSAGNIEWRIEKRSLTNGSLVPGFGTDGAATDNPTTGSDEPTAIAIDSGAMYVVGCVFSGFSPGWRIEKRSLTDGSLVPGFGTGGVVTGDCTGIAEGIAIDSTAMYVVGYDFTSGNNQEWRIEKRSLTNGSLVPGFGAGGVITGNYSSPWDMASGIAIDSTAMYVAGWDLSAGNMQWRTEKRSLTNGSLISAFGTGGVVTSNYNTAWGNVASGIAIDSTAMYVTGADSSFGHMEWRIEKRVK